MKNIKTYTIIATMLTILVLTSCGNSEGNSKVEDEHGHASGTASGNEESDSGNDENGTKDIQLSAQQFEALSMQIDTLSQRKMSGYVVANGQLEVPPQSEANITAVIGSNVVSIDVIEGDMVRKGQVVAYLSHPNLIQKQTDYLNAYSKNLFLKGAYERQQKLYDAGVGSGLNFQKAESEYLVSKAMVNGLEAQLNNFNINTAGVRDGIIYQRVALKSPIEGFVQKVQVKTGQYVAPETELFEIINTHHVHADLMVFEKDAGKVKKGQKVRFNVQSIPGELSAEIYSVGKTFEEDVKAIHVHAEIENKSGELIPGMYIQGKIEVDNITTTAIPESGVTVTGGKFYVFTAEQDAERWSFVPVEVTTGAKDGDWVAINFLEPLAKGTTFAYNNAYYLIAEMKKGESEHSH